MRRERQLPAARGRNFNRWRHSLAQAQIILQAARPPVRRASVTRSFRVARRESSALPHSRVARPRGGDVALARCMRERDRCSVPSARRRTAWFCSLCISPYAACAWRCQHSRWTVRRWRGGETCVAISDRQDGGVPGAVVVERCISHGPRQRVGQRGGFRPLARARQQLDATWSGRSRRQRDAAVTSTIRGTLRDDVSTPPAEDPRSVALLMSSGTSPRSPATRRRPPAWPSTTDLARRTNVHPCRKWHTARDGPRGSARSSRRTREPRSSKRKKRSWRRRGTTGTSTSDKGSRSVARTFPRSTRVTTPSAARRRLGRARRNPPDPVHVGRTPPTRTSRGARTIRPCPSTRSRGHAATATPTTSPRTSRRTRNWRSSPSYVAPASVRRSRPRGRPAGGRDAPTIPGSPSAAPYSPATRWWSSVW